MFENSYELKNVEIPCCNLKVSGVVTLDVVVDFQPK